MNGAMNNSPTALSESSGNHRRADPETGSRTGASRPAPLSINKLHILLAHGVELAGSPLRRFPRRYLVDHHLLHRLRENRAAMHDARERVDALQELVRGARCMLERGVEIGVNR